MFYQRYVDLCDAAGEKPSVAAEKAGFNKGTVSVWKKKYNQGIDVDPDQSVINKICSYFNVSESELRGFGALDLVLPPNMQGVNLSGAKVDRRTLGGILMNLSRLNRENPKYKSTRNAVLSLAKSSGLERMAKDYISKLEEKHGEQTGKAPSENGEGKHRAPSAETLKLLELLESREDIRYLAAASEKATPEHVKATAEMFDKMYGRRSEE